MRGIDSHIRSLECYVERCGGCVVREALPDTIHGGLSENRITLQAGLAPQQQLLALVHELAHWLAHRDSPQDLSARATIYEYEAEAVETLIMGRLGLAALPADSPTDGLLTSSVARVRSTVRRICQALDIGHEG
jgi:IrrE N-terminal-like domain